LPDLPRARNATPEERSSRIKEVAEKYNGDMIAEETLKVYGKAMEKTG
jgi:hypothetical protein